MVIKGTPGASTAVVLSLDRSRATLRWAYIGDSAFAVLRGGRIVHRSAEQQRRFNCPYQLNSDDDGDSLAKAEVGGMPVKDGDVVVAGTDGLFDNVHDDQLARAVQMGTELGFSPKNMADIIAGVAYDVSKTKTERASSPFSIGYRKAYGGNYYGGKEEDITVIVAAPQETGVPPVYPYALLELAYKKAVASAAPRASTAVILPLAGKALKWPYIGDSGFPVLQGGRIARRSKPQRHGFTEAPPTRTATTSPGRTWGRRARGPATLWWSPYGNLGVRCPVSVVIGAM
ncbi:putative protein phosphatase 2C 23 [Panicum miliaceum]|uniref:Protein phosphatase n=1 Tax=Panicum miliaceum TaxID=4540 RepID=A0A3L6QNH5_PANMI|nr:putative protein phosphatase 2C 23 [Panicum miliaceum]